MKTAMKNKIEFEKHPDGIQVYINDSPTAWYASGENPPSKQQYSRQLKADVVQTVAKIKTRHFKLNSDCSLHQWQEFLKQSLKVITVGEYFRAGVGEIYLSVRGVESERNIDQIEDLLFQWRKLISFRRLSKKPQPQKRWSGQWINIIDLRAVI